MTRKTNETSELETCPTREAVARILSRFHQAGECQSQVWELCVKGQSDPLCINLTRTQSDEIRAAVENHAHGFIVIDLLEERIALNLDHVLYMRFLSDLSAVDADEKTSPDFIDAHVYFTGREKPLVVTVDPQLEHDIPTQPSLMQLIEDVRTRQPGEGSALLTFMDCHRDEVVLRLCDVVLIRLHRTLYDEAICEAYLDQISSEFFQMFGELGGDERK